MTVDFGLIDRLNEGKFVPSLEGIQCILDGHFVLRSGNHSDTFINIKGLYPHTRLAKAFGRALALRILRELDGGLDEVRGVIAPAMGGVILAHDCADWISLLSQEFDREVLAFFAEKNREGHFFIGRGYEEYIQGGLFVVVEDVMTTGGSVRELISLIESHGGRVLLVCCIWNRGGISGADMNGINVVSLINRQVRTWTEEECMVDGPCSKEVPASGQHGAGRDSKTA